MPTSIRLPAIFATAFVALTAASCNVERYATSKFGDVIARGGATWTRDDDPELVRAAAPFSLKLVESLLDTEPKHEGLLLTASRGFTQYAYAFVEQDADRAEEKDLARSRELQTRAKKLYRRGRDYGMRGLEVRHPGICAALYHDLKNALVDTKREDVPFLFWTAASWGLSLSLSKYDPMALADQPIVQALIDRAVELDEGWEEGTLHSFLITYEASRPGGQRDWVERTRKHFERSVELSHGNRAAPFVAFAEAVPMKNQDRREFTELLTRALAVDLRAEPDARLENEIAQARARWLKSRTADLFVQ